MGGHFGEASLFKNKGGGGHLTYFVGVGTPHNIYRKSLAVGGWVV